ncbi:MAG TPA: AraC family transcriptional regulator [Tepidisphaeraceae bacterium]|jgi:AraC-like DNA-binding protein|nr:AraC family transcriptional regulator [Tepidisphaeraceae bacterium]
MSSLFSQIRIINAATVTCEPGWSWQTRPERFTHFNLWTVHSGVGQMQLGKTTYDLSAGRVFCFRPYTDAHATHDPKRQLRVTYIHFHFRDARGRNWQPPEGVLPPLTKQIRSTDLFALTCDRISRLDDLPGGRGEAEAYLTAMLIGLRAEHTDPSPDAPALIAAERFIRERPGEVESVAQLARQVGITPEHFARLFRRHFGKAPKDYLIDARISRARDLLSQNQLTVTRVAELLGYGDVFFFSRQFKDRTGLSPIQWRQANPE